MGDGTKENPYTREDILRLIEENGGTAEGLDLSNCKFVQKIDLSGLDLCGIILHDTYLYHARFDGSNLRGADFRHADLQYAKFNPYNSKPACLEGVDLRGAYLNYAEFRQADLSGVKFGIAGEKSHMKARLDNTDLRGAILFRAYFDGCFFYGTKLEGAFIRGAEIEQANLAQVDWGNYKIGEEKEAEKEKGEGKRNEFNVAVHYYRRLKVWYNNAGYSDTAHKFYYREREASRKGASRWNDRAAGWLSWAVFGHGEGWKRILISMVVVIFGFAAAYYFWGSFTSSSFWDILYYSATSFTALGYGQWAPQPTGWAKGMGAAQAIIGAFLMALLLVTFFRKWTR